MDWLDLLTEADIEDAKEQAYNEGYKDGYYHGTEEQREKDCEDFLIDGLSIRGLEELVYEEYGMTPHEAFNIVDAYEFDPRDSGYTWAEYQNAIEAIYCTASIFPQDY